MEGLKPIRVTKEEGGEEGQLLSPMSRIFHQPNSSIYIIVFVGFKTPINPDAIKATLAHIFLKHPHFCSLLVVDDKNGVEMRWVRTQVNIDNHVIVPMLDPSMEMESPDKFVEDYASNLSKTAINKSIPLWDVHLLNFKTSEAESTIILRVHHSLCDGISLMSMLLSCARKVSKAEEPPTIPTIKKRNPKNVNSGGFWQFFLKLWWLMLLCWNTIIDVAMFMATVFFLEDTKTPLKGPGFRFGFESTPGPRRFVHSTISLDDVKLVKNAMDATINDVMMGVTQAGLSRYLNRKYGEIKKRDEATEEKNNLPRNIRLRATLAANIRSSSSIQASDDIISRNTKGNKIGLVLFPFKIALRDDPLEYVREAKVAVDRKKASFEAKFVHFMSKFCSKFIALKIANMPSQTTLGFSNMPGPQEEISYHGHPVAFIAPTIYGQQCGLMIHIMSYVKKMKIILSVDESIVPDPHQLCDDFLNSFQLIKEAVLAEKGFIHES
ncbi:wax ester synthase/diacylglycerol acyltransferase 11-like [Hevea brasiliensis]|nr:wax ester synthase/diacylglycerol acyltransferase 11-like [Hevea brasiliensis]